MFCIDCKKKLSPSIIICPNCSNTKVQNQWIDFKIKQEFEDELRQKRKLKRLEFEAKKAGYYSTIDYVNAKRKAIDDNYKKVQEKKERKQRIATSVYWALYILFAYFIFKTLYT